MNFSTDFTVKYKPRNFSEIILPEKLKKELSVCLFDKPLFPFLLTGPSGVGKTLVATSIKSETYFLSCLDGCNEADLQKLEASISSVTLFGDGRLVILDDVDHLSHKHQLKLIEILDKFLVCNDFIFTASEPFRLKPNFLSRVQVVDFGFSDDFDYRNSLVEYLLKIALLEKKDSFPKISAQKIVRNFYPDIRKMMRQLQTEFIKEET